MKIAAVVNDPKTELAAYTTTRIALAATNRGHDVWTVGVGDFIYSGDGSLHALGRRAPGHKYKDVDSYHAARLSDDVEPERVALADLDILLLRNDPAEDAIDRPWAQTSGILFAELAQNVNLTVLNDPDTLPRALNKTYFQGFPEAVRPRTCITRDSDEIKDFIREEHGKAVLKPLQGSGGQSVFLIKSKDDPNTNQIIEAVLRDGYAVAQEYLPAAAKGDTRLFVMNGYPLAVDGEVCAIHRVNAKGDMRSNMHAGGSVRKPEITDKMLELVEIVRPKLVRDGMWLVGLDVVDDKLMEVNVFSPGGIGSASALAERDFPAAIVRDLERKAALKCHYGASINNVTLATL